MSKSLAHLREVAEKATPGPWTHDEPYLHAVRSRALRGEELASVHISTGLGREAIFPDGDFIATFDPPTVLKLLAVVEAAREHRNMSGCPARLRGLKDGDLNATPCGACAWCVLDAELAALTEEGELNG